MRNLLLQITIISTVLGVSFPAISAPESQSSKANSSDNGEQPAFIEKFSTLLNPEFTFSSDFNQLNLKPLDQQTSEESSLLAQATGSDQFGGTFTPSEETQLLLEDLTPIVDVQAPIRPAAGLTFGTPTAYGAGWRQAFFSVSALFDLGGPGRDADGSFSLGTGFGNPLSDVGLEVSLGITSTEFEDFADSGSVGFKLHKIIPNTEGLGVAIGWSNALDWGDTRDASETIYGVASKFFFLDPNSEENRLPLLVSLGVGTGSFRSLGAIRAGDNDLNVFGSLGLLIQPEFSVTSSWTGSQLNLGVGFAPFTVPLTFSAGIYDITGNTENGAGFNLNAGYAWEF